MATEKKNARIEVFRVGTFIPMNGPALSFSASDLEAVAANYDPDTSPAPIVVGHPKTDDPAFGWAGGFEFNADTGVLHADLKDIAPSFAAAVEAGQYKKVSMSFFQPTAAANPKPGTLYPKHIGFLGAVPPAVPGLTPVSFADHGDDDVITFEGSVNFGSFDAENIGTMFRNVREWLIVKFGKETADEVIPSWRIDWVNDLELNTDDNPIYAAPKDAPKSNTENEDAPMSKEDTANFAAQQKALDEDRAQLDADRKVIDDQRKAAREADNLAFAESLVDDQKIIPATKDKVAALLNAAGEAGTTVSFADSDKPVDLANGIRELLSAQPKVVNFGAHDLGEEPVNFADDPQALADAATAYQSEQAGKGVTMTIDTAVDHVMKGAK